jgi:hypothetical protein
MPKNPTASAKKEMKKKEAFKKVKEVLTTGESAAPIVVDDSNSPDFEPEQQLVDVPPTLPEQNKVEIKKCLRRMKTLEHQIEIAYEHSQFAVPVEIMDGLCK